MTAPNAWQIQAVMSVASATIARMEQTGTLDTDEASLMDALREEVPDVDVLLVRLLRAMGEADANRLAIHERVEALEKRLGRFVRQRDEYRAAVNAILDALGWSKWRHAEFTVSVSAGRAGVAVTDVDALAAEYVRVTRSPDKAAIKAAMEQGVVVDGAEWTNVANTMTVRTK